MSCENCANAYDEGYTAGHNSENARLREQAEALAGALEEAKGNLQWATGGWGQATEEVLAPARITLRKYLAAIDAALRAYREASHDAG